LENQLWFAVISEERKGPFSEEQISTLLKAGSLSERSLVWSKEASTDEWMPLYKSGLQHLVSGAEVAPPPLPPSLTKPQDSSPIQARPPGSPSATRQSLLGQSGPELTDWGTAPVSSDFQSSISVAQAQSGGLVRNDFLTKMLLWIIPPLTILSGRTVMVHFNGSSDIQARYERFIALNQNEAFTIVFGVAGLVWIIATLWWMRNETKNLTVRLGPQSITPAGAIYWFFVPILNIWKPIEATKNIIRGTVTNQLDRTLMLGTAWWITALLAIICYGISTSILDSGQQLTTVTAQSGLNWDLAGGVFDIISSIALFFTISAVQDGHKTRNQ
jgi:hypothetical protein